MLHRPQPRRLELSGIEPRRPVKSCTIFSEVCMRGSAVGMFRRVFLAAGAALVLVVATVGTPAQTPPPGPAATQPPPPGGQPAGRQGGTLIPGPNANPFAGQTPVNAMIVTGGCCHDYTGQSKVLMDTLNAVMPINWTVVQGMSSLPDGKLPLYENPDWAKGMDIVIHNECWANGDLPAQIRQNITRPSVPRMFFHCTLHSYRVMTDDSWRELIGMTSRRHTRAHNILLKWAEGDPITDGLPPFVTPIDELYVIEKVWPNTKALATAVSPEAGNPTFPLVWTHEYRGSRIFGTSLGHGNETFHANQFKELFTRGFRWALKKEPIALPPPPEPQRGGGRGRGTAGETPAPSAPAPTGRGGQ
jgi:hypothetical protein